MPRSTKSSRGLSTGFGQNVLADEKSWSLILSSEDELAGIPDFLRDAMAAAARERGEGSKYAVTLSRSIIEPFLTFSERRDLREQAFKAWVARGENVGATDNRGIIRETLALRDEVAKLLGYGNFAELKLDNTMAKTPEAVNDLLRAVWARAVKRAHEEEADIAGLIAAEGKNHEVMPWDWRHYAEKIRAQRFNFSEAELKPYLQLEKIIDACFDVAGRLFGIRAVEKKGIAAYHPDVRVFEIRDRDDKLVALFLGDYFARSSKALGRLDELLPVAAQAGAEEWPSRRVADHLQCLQLRKTGRRQARPAFARRCAHAVSRVRSCAAWHALQRHLSLGRRYRRLA